MKNHHYILHTFFTSFCQCIIAFILLVLYISLIPRPNVSERFYIIIDIVLPVLIACVGAFVRHSTVRAHNTTDTMVKHIASKLIFRFTGILFFIFLGYLVCTSTYLISIFEGNGMLVLLLRNFLVYLVASAYPIAYALIEFGRNVSKRIALSLVGILCCLIVGTLFLRIYNTKATQPANTEESVFQSIEDICIHISTELDGETTILQLNDADCLLTYNKEVPFILFTNVSRHQGFFTIANQSQKLGLSSSDGNVFEVAGAFPIDNHKVDFIWSPQPIGQELLSLYNIDQSLETYTYLELGDTFLYYKWVP